MSLGQQNQAWVRVQLGGGAKNKQSWATSMQMRERVCGVVVKLAVSNTVNEMRAFFMEDMLAPEVG